RSSRPRRSRGTRDGDPVKAKRRVTTVSDVRGGSRAAAPHKVKPPVRSSASPSTVSANRAATSAARPAVAGAARTLPDAGPIPSARVELAVDLGRGLVLPNPIL